MNQMIKTALLNFVFQIEDRRQVLDNLQALGPMYTYDPCDNHKKYCIEEEKRADQAVYDSFTSLMGLVIDEHESNKRMDERESARERDR